MLLECINHHSNLPFRIAFTNIAEEDNHYHKEMEIMFVLRGTTNCKIHHWNYSMLAGDVLMVDTEDLHRIYNSSDDMLMLTMHIDLEHFTGTYPNLDYIIFAPEDCTQGSATKHQTLNNKMAFLKSRLAKIMSTFMDNKDDSDLLMKEINEFVFILVNQFQGFFVEDMQFKLGNDDASEIDQARILRIVKYIYLNYDKKITLDDLAALEYLSTYYISHLIKKVTGLSFQNFLNYTRIEFAEKLLIEGKLSLTQISEFCGFSSLAYFDRCFKIWHGITPAQYRHKLCPCQRRYGKDFSQEEAMTLLRHYWDAGSPYQKNDRISKAPDLLYIPVNDLSSTGKNFGKTFSLCLFIDSVEDLFRVSHYEKELIGLCPSHIYVGPTAQKCISSRQAVLDILHVFLSYGCLVEFVNECPSLPDISIDNVAEAFAYMMHKKNPCLSIFGTQNSLITQDGLFTPWYYLHEIFSKIKGNVISHDKHYMKIRNEDMQWILVYQETNNCRLKAHIDIGDVSKRCTIIEKRFCSKTSCYEAINQFEEGSIGTWDFQEYINQSSAGICKIKSLSPEESPTFCPEIEPGSFVCFCVCF